jgi:predicted amidohydrolase YtcJ
MSRFLCDDMAMKIIRILALSALSISGCGVVSQAPNPAVPADTILYGGKVVTLDQRSSVAQAVALRDGRFVAVGGDAEVRKLAGPATRMIDLGGRTVIPGLNDTHTHFKAAGLALYTVNLRGAKSVAEALEAIRAFAARKKPGEWVIGGAWHPPSQLFEKRYLTRQEIDRAAPDNPVYLPTVGHFVMANSRALALAKIDKGTPNPEGGVIERDAAGEATGVLVGPAIGLLTRAVPDWTYAEQLGQYRQSMQILNSHGITSTIDGGLDMSDVRLLKDLAGKGQQTLRVGVMYRPAIPKELAQWEESMKAPGGASGTGDEWVRLVGVKLGFDGGMTLRTAHTRNPYPDDPKYHGLTYMTFERLKELAEISDRYGWRVGVHVVGDKAVDLALAAFEALDQKRPLAGKRFVLIHASLMQRDQMERARRLGLRADVQNVFMWDKAATVERFLGKETANRAVPTRTLIEVMGIENVGAGTDFPVNVIDPFLGMYIMVTRKDPRGVVYGASEAITREQALRLYTSSAARYSFEEKAKGTIEPGKLADLVVLSGDLFTVPEEAIKDLKAVTTMVGGKVVYQRSWH